MLEWVYITENKENTTNIEHIYREKTDKHILRKNPWKDYRLHLTILVLVIIAELIGSSLQIFISISFIKIPFIFLKSAFLDRRTHFFHRFDQKMYVVQR